MLRENYFDNLIIVLIQIYPRVKLNETLFHNYELLLIEFINCIIKNTVFITNCKQIDLDNLLLYSFTVFYCINDFSKLNISEQYFKLEKNSLISLIIKECFEIHNVENINIHLKATFEFSIKLMILRISKLFSEMNNDTDSYETKYNLIQNLSYFINFYFSIFNFNLRNLDNMSESSGENIQEESVRNSHVFNLNDYLNNLSILFSCHFEFCPPVPNLGQRIKAFLDMIKKELLKNFKLDNNVAFILELVRKLLSNFSVDFSFSNQEIINILLPFGNSKSITNNSNLLLFDILYYDYFSENIKNYLKKSLETCSYESFNKGKESGDKIDLNGPNLEKIFRIFEEELNHEKSFLSMYFKEFLNMITDLIIEFLDKNISRLQFNESKEKSQLFHYDYLAYICDKLFQDSLRKLLNKLGLVSLLDKLSEIQVLFLKVKKDQIEAEIISNRLPILKMVFFG